MIGAWHSVHVVWGEKLVEDRFLWKAWVVLIPLVPLVLALLCTVPLVLGGCATRKTTGKVAETLGIATGFINKTMTMRGNERKFVVYVPHMYDPGRAWPVIVFLHGVGESGDDGLSPTDVGLGHAIRTWPERFPCLAVFPQCPRKTLWGKDFEDVDVALAQTQKEYNLDPHRIYLTGLSLGGYGAWVYGAQRADIFAALMPICGGGRVEDAPRLANVPIWAFHGAEDTVVEPSESRKIVEAVKRAGGMVKYTEYPDIKHNAWDNAYGDPRVIKWLLKQTKERVSAPLQTGAQDTGQTVNRSETPPP
jgi:predicted peptidase